MRVVAGLTTLLAHTVAFVGLGSVEIDSDPIPAPIEATTIELVELPALPTPVEEEPLPAPAPAPEAEPTAAPEPAPAKPSPRARPKPSPAAPNPTPEPTASSAPPTPATTAEPGLPAATGPVGPTPAAPRKLGQRFSNAPSTKGRQRSTAKRCTEKTVKPVPTVRVKAKFPAATLRSGISGDLVLRANVDQRGAVTSVTVVKSPGASVEPAAKTAFAQWRFTPATACGKAVPSTFTKRSTFTGG